MSNINIKICEVISVDDNHKSGRIKVKLHPEDDRKHIDNIQYVYPLLPKMFSVLPKIGEAVIVFLTASGDGFSNRYYIGPIISQLPNLEYDGYFSGALSNYEDSLIKPKVAHNLISEATGSFGLDNDVCIYGRKGTDIILKEDDIRIRAGARLDSNNKIGKEFNRLNPSYLKLKYNNEPTSVINQYTGEEYKYNSTATLVADQINLIANNANTYFNTTNNEELISDDEMKKIIETAHALPFGDILVDFLKYFLRMFQEHAHPYPGLPTILPSGNENFFNYDLNKILSKNVRIN
jgi:hypothetical protein